MDILILHPKCPFIWTLKCCYLLNWILNVEAFSNASNSWWIMVQLSSVFCDWMRHKEFMMTKFSQLENNTFIQRFSQIYGFDLNNYEYFISYKTVVSMMTLVLMFISTVYTLYTSHGIHKIQCLALLLMTMQVTIIESQQSFPLFNKYPL